MANVNRFPKLFHPQIPEIRKKIFNARRLNISYTSQNIMYSDRKHIISKTHAKIVKKNYYKIRILSIVNFSVLSPCNRL